MHLHGADKMLHRLELRALALEAGDRAAAHHVKRHEGIAQEPRKAAVGDALVEPLVGGRLVPERLHKGKPAHLPGGAMLLVGNLHADHVERPHLVGRRGELVVGDGVSRVVVGVARVEKEPLHAEVVHQPAARVLQPRKCLGVRAVEDRGLAGPPGRFGRVPSVPLPQQHPLLAHPAVERRVGGDVRVEPEHHGIALLVELLDHPLRIAEPSLVEVPVPEAGAVPGVVDHVDPRRHAVRDKLVGDLEDFLLVLVVLEGDPGVDDGLGEEPEIGMALGREVAPRAVEVGGAERAALRPSLLDRRVLLGVDHELPVRHLERKRLLAPDPAPLR